MNNIASLAAGVAAVCLSSCVDEYPVITEGQSGTIAIDAMLVDIDSVQTVFIRKSGDIYFKEFHRNEDPEPIEGASVKVEDDLGWSACFEDETGLGRRFSLSGHQFEAGRTYTVTVTAEGRTFTATEKMVAPPKVNGIKFFQHDTKDDTLWSPILYMEDSAPDETNYYLFRGMWFPRDAHDMHFLYAMRLSDEGLRSDMEGIRIALGIGAGDDAYSGIQLGEIFSYTLYTISKRNYDYYGTIEAQMTSDGGLYRPTPTSAVSNFSGERVQGQLIAAAGVMMKGRLTPEYLVEE